jgi:hypothetical protein
LITEYDDFGGKSNIHIETIKRMFCPQDEGCVPVKGDTATLGPVGGKDLAVQEAMRKEC